MANASLSETLRTSPKVAANGNGKAPANGHASAPGLVDRSVVHSGTGQGGAPRDKLAKALIDQGLVQREVVDRALAIKAAENQGGVGVRAKRALAQILVEDLDLDHDLVFSVVAEVYGFEITYLQDEDYGEERIDFIRKMFEPISKNTREYMIEKRIVAFRYDSSRPYRLIFLAADPTDRMAPAIARAMKAQSYDIQYVRKSQMDRLIEAVFPPENEFLAELDTDSIQMNEEEIEEEGIDEAQIEAEINKSLLVNLAEGMLIEAVRLGASDIHIIPRSPSATDIRFRVDGMLRDWHTQEGVRPEAISAVMKDRARNIDRFERDVPQDGFIQRKIDGHQIRFRVSVIPIVGAEYKYKFESIVIRVLDDRKVITDLDKLGFQGGARQAFVKAIKQPQGMVIVTGPTGSGKSTTLIAALSHIVTPELNVLTVEDPVEYLIPNVRQLKIGQKMDFEKALRSILRHDPDVVMLGEVRDKITGDTAIKLANTGHLTFTTLHTNDAPSAISRLFKMGIETFLIAYAINIVIAQRLMRRLCDHCKRPMREPDPAELEALGFGAVEAELMTIYEPVGCEHCHNGYKGRVAIHEALYFSKTIRTMIFEAKGDIDEEAIRQQAIEEGMLTLMAAARERVKEGTTSLEEVARVTSE